jgi:hypothetical protein
MQLKEQVKQDLISSLKAGDSLRSLTLRMLLAAMVNKEKEGKGEVTEDQLLQVVAAEAKKRREAAEAFLKGGRSEQASKEQEELKVLLGYLPEQLSEQEIRDLAQEAVATTGASSIKDMGKVMAHLAPQTKGRADGAKVSFVVKELLS